MRMDSSQTKEPTEDDKLAEELKVLNENFLSSIQDALEQSPDGCLAPLLFDYLKYIHPLLQKGSDGKKNSEDLVEIAKFFNSVKSSVGDQPTVSSSDSNTTNGNIDGAKSGGFIFTKPAAAAAETEKKTATPGPGFFGLPVPKSEASKVGTSSSSLSGTASSSVSATPSVSTGFRFGEQPKTAFSSTTSSSESSSFFGKTITASTAATSSSTVGSSFSFSLAKNQSLATAPSPSFSASSSNLATALAPTFGASSSKRGGSPLFGGFQASTASAGPSSSSGFSFTAPSGFGGPGPSYGLGSAGSSGAVNGTENKGDDNSDDEDQPPKPDHVPVVEDDAVFTQRIKLFEMEGKQFKDLGIGNLFVKPLPSGKYQLLVRADNSLGTILINAVLNPSIPVRQNKPTNILVTLPSTEGKPTTYLVRVKDATQGNDLTQALEKYKSSSTSS